MSTAADQGARARLELAAVVTAGVAGVAAFAVGLALLQGGTHPIGGAGSVARVAAFTTGFAGAGSFAVARVRSAAPLPTLSRRLRRTLTAAATIAMALVVFGLGYLAAVSAGEVFQAGFVGLELDAFAGALVCGIAAGAAAYLAHPLGDDISTRTLAVLVPTFLVVGVLFSMLTASDERWWQVHFSSLGAGGGVSGFAFNMTLVLSGVLVATLGGCVRSDLDLLTQRDERGGAEWVGRLLAAIGACMALTGLVRVDVAEWLHIAFASSMVVIFAVLCAGLPWFAPHLPRVVHVASAAMVAGTVVALVLWVPVGYYNFTGFEFAACGLIFVWLSVFVRALGAASADRADAAGGAGARGTGAAGTDAAGGARAPGSTSGAVGGKVVA
ncbi:DUF998 domain-containing protein [Agrococcus carbonis]|uniref:DUF998 domain-containing protein n=1 Tax=Agrococcus carbonis TaxID=684552 RepID=A0A1H1NZU2_9MICO|nr:DUF998 domain-containing protein [Agrococcus carbonis]SDS04295.1 Protein of unknown function [Agrococcus carbonis]